MFGTWKSLAFVILVLHEGDAIVKGLGAVFALRNEVEAHAANVLLGTEVLEVVHLLALYLELHQAPVLQTYAVSVLQMSLDGVSQPDDGTNHFAPAERTSVACLLDKLF